MAPDGGVPYGAWPSPITASALVQDAAGVGEIRADGADVWWTEARPAEGGRIQLVRRTPAGTRHDLFGPPDEGRAWNVRTQVHEYGGGAWVVRDGTVVFADWADQRLYRVEVAGGAEPRPITPAPTTPRGYRWAEPVWLDDQWLVCVRESHEPDDLARHGEAVNELVAVAADGRAVDDAGQVVVLVSGPDFVGAPAAHGDQVAWTQWDHPHMPWDETTLWVGTVDRDVHGSVAGLSDERLVAGGPSESVVQPAWDSDGTLVFATDRTGWWNPHRFDGESVHPLITSFVDDSGEAHPTRDGVHAEIGGPAWVFGARWIAPLPSGRVACSITRDGLTGLAVVETDGRLVEVESPYTSVDQIVAGPEHPGGVDTVLLVAATPDQEVAPVLWTIEPPDPAAGDRPGSVDADRTPTLEVLRPGRDLGIGPEWFAPPQSIAFESAAGRTAHALYYAPTNPDAEPVPGTRPPLLVLSHGGPTSAARARLDLSRQYWTSRGFAVVDVNYGGSSGYGRAYRRQLDGQWGIVDVEDCIAAANHLAAEGLADPDRLAIRGGSAGGYTTLAALAFHDDFAAGASHYGVADLGALARDTHKFESRYLDGLVGPYPAAKPVYDARSPIEHTDGLSCPLIVLQGLEDEVVPPNQAEMMIAALAAKGVPHAYVAFEGEQHGFRRAENIMRALEAELWFYGRVFGFDPADDIEPVADAVGLD